MEHNNGKGFFPTEDPVPVATRGVPLKVTIPNELMHDLNLFSECYGASKSEIIRVSLKNTLSADPRWSKRAYFFKPKNPQVTYDSLQACSGIVSIVAGPNEYAKSAMRFCAKLLKFNRKESVVEFFDLSNVPPPEAVNLSRVNLNSGTLVIPDLLPANEVIHRIDNSFLWDVER